MVSHGNNGYNDSRLGSQANNYNDNGYNGNGDSHILQCSSDYENRPVIDILPSKPSPKWRDQLAPVTWSMSYIDSSNISHSVTLRGDSEEEVLEMVKPLVAGIRKAKGNAKKEQQQDNTQPESVVCKIHSVQMERRVSKRTGGHYHCHRMPDGKDLCFGREKRNSDH